MIAAAFERSEVGNTFGARIYLSTAARAWLSGLFQTFPAVEFSLPHIKRKHAVLAAGPPPFPWNAPGCGAVAPLRQLPAPGGTGPRPPGPGFRRDFVRRRFPSPALGPAPALPVSLPRLSLSPRGLHAVAGALPGRRGRGSRCAQGPPAPAAGGGRRRGRGAVRPLRSQGAAELR